MNDLIAVAGGLFTMGRLLTDEEIRHLPRRGMRGHIEPEQDNDFWRSRTSLPPNIHVDSFWMSIFPVTQREWQQIMDVNPSCFRDEGRPVESITWHDAITYCNVRSRGEGFDTCYGVLNKTYTCDFHANGYRLPTEAEWEYAARGGEACQHFIFPGSDDADEVAWHCLNSNNESHAVGHKQPNELGLFDMAGNVYEMCWDWYAPQEFNVWVNPTGPKRPAKRNQRVARGGCYKNSPHLLYIGRRLGRDMSSANDHLGFRVVRSIL